MPHCKKGRMTAAARKEVNQRRAQDAINGTLSDVAFARVTKILGSNHVRVALASRRGPIEVHARIPNIFARRGTTPITTRDVVTIYVGNDFDVDADDFATAHFDITSILTGRQSYNLYKEGTVPKWMVHEEGSAVADGDDDGQFEFDYSEDKVDEEAEGGAGSADKPNPRKAKRPDAPDDDDNINIDDI